MEKSLLRLAHEILAQKEIEVLTEGSRNLSANICTWAGGHSLVSVLIAKAVRG